MLFSLRRLLMKIDRSRAQTRKYGVGLRFLRAVIYPFGVTLATVITVVRQFVGAVEFRRVGMIVDGVGGVGGEAFVLIENRWKLNDFWKRTLRRRLCPLVSPEKTRRIFQKSVHPNWNRPHTGARYSLEYHTYAHGRNPNPDPRDWCCSLVFMTRLSCTRGPTDVIPRR